MDNQHKKIKGYRDLTQSEIDLINRVKEHGEGTKALLKELWDMRVDDNAALHNKTEDTINGLTADDLNESMRALSIAKTELQTGQMWFVRAIALPGSF